MSRRDIVEQERQRRLAEKKQQKEQELAEKRLNKANYNKAKTGANKDLINEDFKQIDNLWEDKITTKSGEVRSRRKQGLSKGEAARKNAITSHIADRYGLTEKEVDKLYNIHEKQQNIERQAQAATKSPLNKAVSTYAASVGDTLLSGVEGVVGNIIDKYNYSQGEDVTADDPTHYFANAKKAKKDAIRDTIKSDAGKTAYDLGTMGLEIGANIGAGALTGGGAWVPSLLGAGQESDRSMVESLERGADVNNAFNAAMARGVTQAALNKIGFREGAVNGVGDVVKNVLGNMVTEGAANAAQEGLSYLTDNYFLGNKSTGNEVLKQSLRDTYNDPNMTQEEKIAQALMARNDYYKQNALAAAGQGALFGGLMSAVNNIPRLKANADIPPEGSSPEAVISDATRQAEQATQEIETARQQIPETPVNNVPNPNDLKASNIPTRDIPPTNDVPPTGNVPPNGGIKNYDIPETDKTRESDVFTNTLRNADIVTEEMYNNDPIFRELAEYAVHNNEQTFDAALNNVKNDGAALLNEYINGSRKINNDLDVDQSMILLTSLTRRLEDLGDAAPESLIAQRNLLASRLRRAGTQYGQTIQAFAKYNNTADGAIINGERILADFVNDAKTTNQQMVDANERLAESLLGDYDTIKNDQARPKGNEKIGTSNRLDKALRQMGYDGSMDAEPKPPKTHEQHRAEVANSIKKELGSVAEQLNETDYEYLTSLVENKVPVDIITDEIEHRLNHGNWYTIDESTPVKKATSGKLANILKNMGDESRKGINKLKPDADITYPAKSHATIADEVTNTLAKEAAGLGLDTPTDIEFITTMIEEKVPNWQIEDEINHRLMTGEWYTLDESIEEPKPINKKLKNALDSLVNTEERPVKPKPTLDEIRNEVRNTLDYEPGKFDYTDGDVEYIANLINEGATKQELADALNTKMLTGKFGISEETQRLVNQDFEEANHFDPNSKQAVEARNRAYQRIANEVVIGDASPLEKFDAYRYIAMLGNLKTMDRNYIGNKSFGALTGISNNLSALLEAGTDNLAKKLGGEGIQRTKAILNPVQDAELIKAAKADGDAYRYNILKGEKYEKMSQQDRIKAQKSVFKSKAMQTVEKGVEKGISDYGSVKSKYGTSLAGYMKANGLDKSAFDADNTYRGLLELSRKQDLTPAEKAQLEELKPIHEAMEKARDYASGQAEYATFHEDNAVAQLLTKHSRDWRNSDNPIAKMFGYMIEGNVPFKKTPANIVRSEYDFSPFSLATFLKKAYKLAWENTGKRKGNLADTYTKKNKLTGENKTVNKTTTAEVFDALSKTLTGSGLTALGYWMYNKGIIHSSKKGEKYQDDLEGKQNYSLAIDTPWGEHTITVDWLVPAAFPILLGAEIAKIKERHALSDQKVYENFDDVMSTVNTLLDPMLETTMMQGVKNTFEAAANDIKYDENGAVGGILGSMTTNMLLGYASQGIPTVSGQIARTVDPLRRSTDTATDQSFLGGMEKQGRKMMNKIPGLSMLNNEYRDAYGRTQQNSPFNNVAANFLYQTLSPAYIEKVNETDADTMAREVYNAKDANGVPMLNDKVFPTWKGKMTYEGHKLDPDEMNVYRKESGEAQYNIRTELAHNELFNQLDAEKQNEILTNVNTVVNKVGLEAAGYPQSGKEFEVYQQSGAEGLANYYIEGKLLNQLGLKNSEENRTLLETKGIGAVKEKIGLSADAPISQKETSASQTVSEETPSNQVQRLTPNQLEEQYGVSGENAIYAYNKGVTGEELSVLRDMELYPGKKGDYRDYADLHASIPKIVATPEDYKKLYADVNSYNPKTKGVGQKDLLNYLNANDPKYWQDLVGVWFRSKDDKKTLIRNNDGMYEIIER